MKNIEKNIIELRTARKRLLEKLKEIENKLFKLEEQLYSCEETSEKNEKVSFFETQEINANEPTKSAPDTNLNTNKEVN